MENKRRRFSTKQKMVDLRAKFANVESTLLSNIDAKVTEVLSV